MFDGIDDYVELPTWEMGGATSIEVYAKVAALTNYATLFGSHDHGDAFSGQLALFLQKKTTKLTLQIRSSGNASSAESNDIKRSLKAPASGIKLGVWSHIVSTVGSTGVLEIFIDGISVASDGSDGIALVSKIRTTHSIGVSTWFANQGYFQGTIRYLGIYDRALALEDQAITALKVGLAGASFPHSHACLILT